MVFLSYLKFRVAEIHYHGPQEPITMSSYLSVPPTSQAYTGHTCQSVWVNRTPSENEQLQQASDAYDLTRLELSQARENPDNKERLQHAKIDNDGKCASLKKINYTGNERLVNGCNGDDVSLVQSYC